jgi:hypothetical protein
MTKKPAFAHSLKLDLVEVSLVTFPANDDARVEAVKFKLAHGQLPTIREFEKLLREAGFSKDAIHRGRWAWPGLSCSGVKLRASQATIDGLSTLSSAVADFRLPSL